MQCYTSFLSTITEARLMECEINIFTNSGIQCPSSTTLAENKNIQSFNHTLQILNKQKSVSTAQINKVFWLIIIIIIVIEIY